VKFTLICELIRSWCVMVSSIGFEWGKS